jgi:hypothetical protein
VETVGEIRDQLDLLVGRPDALFVGATAFFVGRHIQLAGFFAGA